MNQLIKPHTALTFHQGEATTTANPTHCCQMLWKKYAKPAVKLCQIS